MFYLVQLSLFQVSVILKLVIVGSLLAKLEINGQSFYDVEFHVVDNNSLYVKL